MDRCSVTQLSEERAEMKVYAMYNEFWDRHIDSLYLKKAKAQRRVAKLRKDNNQLPESYIFIREMEVIE